MKSFRLTFVLAFVVWAKLTSSQNVPIETEVVYDDGLWIGTLGCKFQGESDCDLSIHVEGRRIDVTNHSASENVFVSCVSSDTSIAYTITNFTYDDVQDYFCLEDTTREQNHAWIVAYPDLIVQGIETVGAQVHLTCNSFPGAPIYWIFPGKDEDNADVKISTFVNDNNASSVATLRLQDKDNYAEYKCCMRLKPNQLTETPCASYTFHLDDTLTLISTYQNYKDTNSLTMNCIFQSNPTPDPDELRWLQCNTVDSCTEVYSSYWTYHINDIQQTLNTSLKISYSSSYTSYICIYQSLNYTFNVNTSNYAPSLVPNQKSIFYSTEGYAVTLGCLVTASPAPEITWTKTAINDLTNGSSTVVSDGNYNIETNEVSTDEWQTSLIIYPYNTETDIATFTCSAKNQYGEMSLPLNTNEGPSNLDLQMVLNTSDVANMWATCSFQMFPYPPTYEFNVLISNNISYGITTKYDEQLSKITLTTEILGYENLYPIAVECVAFDRFDHSRQITKRFTVDNGNFTTTEATTINGFHVTTLKP
ncbi:hypothetical protein CHUAL_007447 [Chamberlinius hualienensis]